MKKRINADNSKDNNITKIKDNAGSEKKLTGIHLRKADMILVASLILIALVFYIVLQFVVKKDGETVVIKVDGTVRYELPLDKDTDLTVEGYQGGSNQIIIKDKSVRMSEADCPDKICVHTGKITKTGETIVCLPHRVVVEINGKQKHVDAVVN